MIGLSSESLPPDWVMKRLDFVARVKARLGWKGLTASEYVEDGYAFLSTPNIKGRDVDFTDVNYITAERYYESPEIMLQLGDVLLAKDGSTLGTCGVVRGLPRPSTVNGSIAVIRPKPPLDPIYLYYLLSSPEMQARIRQFKGGMGVPHLFQSDLRKFAIVLPPKQQQRAIADFLDRETAKIDELVECKSNLFCQIEAREQSLIASAVCCGLNGSVRTRAIGIPWIGDVPEHWELLHLRRVVKKFVDYRGRTPEKVLEGIPLVTAVNIKKGRIDMGLGQEFMPEADYDDWMVRGLPERGDLLVTTEAPLGEVAQIEDTRVALAQRIILLKVNKEKITNEYLKYFSAQPPGRVNF